MLAVFFVTAKLLNDAPKPLVWTAAALAYLAAPHTGSLLVDEFAARFVFFYTGYWAAPVIFRYAARVAHSPAVLVAGSLAAWAAINWLLVQNGLAFTTGLDLWVSFAGVAAIVAFSVVTAPTVIGRAFAACGRNSIKIYLAFPLFMAPARVLALKSAAEMPDWLAALFSAGAGVAGALILAQFVKGTRLDVLFKRPAAFSLVPKTHQKTASPPRIAVI